MNVEKFRERLRTWEEGSALPLSEVIQRIERERDHESDPGEATIPIAIYGVQLRTVHSAKGLEFPIVIVPELSRGVNKRATITDSSQRRHSLAYLEIVADEPVHGIKGPFPANSFETIATPDYEITMEVQQQEIRAESRRLLYVARTRVRDHLLLTSTHTVGSDSEATFGDYDTGEQASCWRDLIQPILLEDRELLADLATTGVATRSLGDSQYSVRRPPTPVSGPVESATTDRAFDIELPEPSESPVGVALSATVVRDLVSDYPAHKKLQTDTEPTSTEQGSFLEDLVSSEGLTSTQFGTAVHRLCELPLTSSTIDWSTTPGQIVGDPEGFSPMVIEDLRNQVQYAVSDVQQFETGLTVRTTYNEYQVRLELTTGQVVGDIDHLTVTDDCYYISDYKTDSLRNRDIEAVAEHYFTQLRLYACALSQANSTRDCVLRLIFTNEEATKEETLSLNDIDQ
ncbi:3'-5' exonuclease [Natronorarus salvus]|uniref:3'-5' exonuclease n=1 Tax=Natronorarus salvus TaxID=3117733 RepID=UPI0039084007